MTKPSTSTTWAMRAREEFIRSRIDEVGRFNRSELFEKFGVSSATAAADIRRICESDPEFMRYDKHAKVFRPTNQIKTVNVRHLPIMTEVLNLVSLSPLTQVEIQHRAGYSPAMIADWKGRDGANPTIQSIVNILQVLGYELVIQKKNTNANSNSVKPVSNPGQPLLDRFRIA